MPEMGGTVSDLSVLHVGAGRYAPDDRSHSTFAIWRALAGGFRRYTVVGRSAAGPAARIDEDGLSVRLLASRMAREAEFLTTQFGIGKIAEEVEADVIVCQCPALGGFAAMRVAARTGARVLLELHMGNYMEPSGALSRDRLIQTLSARTLPKADRIRVLSAGMKARLLARYGEDLEDKVAVLPPRVDLARFSTVKTEEPAAERFTLAIVGAITERKGQRRLIEALYGGGFEGDLWIIGDGPERAACEALAGRLGAAERVSFLGRLTHEDLAARLPRADALVCYSSMEGTPRAIMEGMACGLPVITTDAGYCADIVSDDVEGFVLRGGWAERAERLNAAVARFAEDPALRSRLGAAARARAEREFDAEMLYRRYRALIRDTAAA